MLPSILQGILRLSTCYVFGDTNCQLQTCYCQWHVVQFVSKATARVLGKFWGTAIFFCFAVLLAIWRLVCARSALPPAISTLVSLVFLCLQANAEMVPKFQVAVMCFSCNPLDFKFSKIKPLPWGLPNYFFVIWDSFRHFFCSPIKILPG
jgi:hypothetical protein